MKQVPISWEIKEILALLFIKNISYKKIKKFVEKYISFDEFLNAEAEKQKELFGTVVNYLDEAEKQLELCEENNIKLITIWDDNYPELLKTIDYPPTLLYVKGSLQNSEAYSISIVGTRRSSTYGKLCAEKFVEEFARHNIIITSGLAYGIDSISHKQAIKNNGITYAVIASGIDKIQSEVSKKLADEIVYSGGAVISEYRCGTTSRPGYFPQRNRIISGISKATLVVESAKKGGSLITARFAQEQSREVFAIPGAIGSEKSEGCNWLIYNNIATLSMSPKNVLLDLGLKINNTNNEKINTNNLNFNSQSEKEVYLALDSEPQGIDSLSEKTNLEISELLVILLELEFSGLVRQLPGKLYIREFFNN